MEEELLIDREVKHQEIIEAILSIPKEATDAITELIKIISSNNQTVNENILKCIKTDSTTEIEEIKIIVSELIKNNNVFCEKLLEVSSEYKRERKVVIKVTERDQRGFISEITGTIS